jgi:hypothetical protein
VPLLMLPATIMIPAQELDGAVAELHLTPYGIVIAEIRIPAPKRQP